MSDIQDRLLAAFQVEHREHLLAVRAMLSDLARRNFDAVGFDFEEAHRRLHSLKGAARVVGLRPVEVMAHRLETLISLCLSGELTLDREITDVIHLAFDGIEDCAAALQSRSMPTEPLDALGAVERLLSVEPGTPRGGNGTEEDETGGGSGRRAPNRPDADTRGLRQGKEASPTQLAPAAPGIAETARVSVDSLDTVLKHVREASTETLFQLRVATELRELQRDLEVLVRDLVGESHRRYAGFVSDAGRDESAHEGRATAERVSVILDRVKNVGRLQRDAAWRFKSLSAQIHRDVRTMRIVPADSVFGGIRKVVRDLARAESKQIEMNVTGLDTEVDRQVLQTLKDPVMHLLRNAVNHGIETPEKRVKHRKPPKGRIDLSISTDRNRLVVRIEDDGSGLDRARILEEAGKRGLIGDDAAVSWNLDALTPLLVRPGFTTARDVTEIAGRGIGLSVVDKAVRQLQGRFALFPGGDCGTVATISVPLTAASSRLLLVQCGGNICGIPLHWVERLCRIRYQDITTVQGEPVIAVNGEDEPVPLASLPRLLGHPQVAVRKEDEDGDVSVVLLRGEAARLGLAVDAFVSVQEGVVHDLDAAIPGLTLLAGGLHLADGSVAIVIDPTALVRAARETKHVWLAGTSPQVARSSAPMVLVVDDSITTRTLEKSILEAKGFRVLMSVDGIDALDRLRREPADLVIVDIEMPRMDGFELLHAMKGDESLADIPVILVTSRDSAQDRRKGLALGAEAYIVKQRFDQRELLEAIDQLL